MAMGLQIRKMLFKNASSGKVYEVAFKQATNGDVSGVGRLLGTGKINSDPGYDNTEVSFVVLTSKVAKVFGTGATIDSELAQGAYYDASNKAGAGALLSTLLV